jgi:hypothetical protein
MSCSFAVLAGVCAPHECTYVGACGFVGACWFVDAACSWGGNVGLAHFLVTEPTHCLCPDLALCRVQPCRVPSSRLREHM